MSLLNELQSLAQADNRTDQRSSLESLLFGDNNLLKLAKEAVDTETDWNEVWKIVSHEGIRSSVLAFYGGHQNSTGLRLDSGFLLGQWLGIPAAARATHHAMRHEYPAMVRWMQEAAIALGGVTPDRRLSHPMNMGIGTASFDGGNRLPLHILDTHFHEMKLIDSKWKIGAARDLCRYFLGASPREVKHKCESQVLFARDGKGHVATLLAEVFDGHGECYFDPEKHALLPMGTEFTDAIRTAWNVACRQEGWWFDPKHHDIRWRVKGDNIVSLDGPSMGMASAITFTQSLRRGYLDEAIAITGAIQEDGVLTPVESVALKSRAALGANKQILVCTANHAHAVEGCPEKNVLRADTFTEAIHHAGGVIGGMCDYFAKMQKLPNENLPLYFGERKLTELYVKPDFLKYEIVERKRDEEKPDDRHNEEPKELVPEKGHMPTDLEDRETKTYLQGFDKVEKRISWQEGFEEMTHSQKRTVIIGQPGAGKSLLTRMIAHDIANQATRLLEQGDKIESLPICVSLLLTDLIVADKVPDDETELSEYLIGILQAKYKIKYASAKFLVDQLPHKGILTLDALDEVPLNKFDKLNRVLGWLATWNCAIVITGRKYGYEERQAELAKHFGELLEYSMATLERGQQEALIRIWFRDADQEKSQTLVERIDSADHIGRMAETPFLVILLCALQNEGDIPTDLNRAGLYEKIILRMLNEHLCSKMTAEENNEDEPEAIDFFGSLAEISNAMFESSTRKLELKKNKAIDWLAERQISTGSRTKARRYLNALLRSRILEEIGPKEQEDCSVRFAHKSFGEYFMAHWYVKYLPMRYFGTQAKNKTLPKWDSDVLREIDQKVWRPDWQEVFFFLAGMMEEPAVLLEMLTDEKKDDLAFSRFCLAAKCLTELAEDKQKKHQDFIDKATTQCVRLYQSEPTKLVQFQIKEAVASLGKLNGSILDPEIQQQGKNIIEWLTHQLSASDRYVQSRAAYALERYLRVSAAHALDLIGEKKPQKVFPKLVLALNDKNWYLRSHAASTLGQMGEKAIEAIPQLILALNDKESYVRSSAAGALKQMGEKAIEAIPQLIPALNDEDLNVRSSAAYALGQIGKKQPQRVVPQLVLALNDKESQVRSGAADALKQMGEKAIEAIPQLILALNDKESYVRSSAADALKQMGEKAIEAIPQLIFALNDKKSYVRSSAASALGNMGEKASEAVPQLILALNDKDSYVHYNVTYALYQIGKKQLKRVVPQLVLALNDKESQVRSGAAYALGYIGKTASSEVVPQLVLALNDKESYVRSSAASALGQIGEKASEAVPQLILALNDEDSNVRRSAASALGQIGEKASEAVPQLILALNDEDSNVRRSAASALGQIGEKASEAVPQLILALSDKKSSVRCSAAYALRGIGEKAGEAVSQLILALNDKDSGLRSFAAYALGGIGEKASEAIPQLILALNDKVENVRDSAFDTLEKMGEKASGAVPQLVHALGDKESEVRGGAASVLGAIGEKASEAIPQLILALSDKEAHVSSGVAHTLGRIGEKRPQIVLKNIAKKFDTLLHRHLDTVNTLISRLYAVSTYRLFRINPSLWRRLTFRKGRVVAIDVANPDDLDRLAKLRLES